MSIEIEAKIKVDKLEDIEKRLLILGAEPVGKWEEYDTFYDTSDNMLRSKDSALRLRVRKSITTNEHFYKLTYKGPREEGKYKAREEIEISVDSPENVDMLLQAIGFKVVISYSKRRATWKLNECIIELDSLEDLGNFVEIEGPDEKSISKIIKLLSLENYPVVNKTYLEMIAGGERSKLS